MNDTTIAMSKDEREADSTVVFGFWLFLMTDFVLFAALFATYVVLRGNVFGGPGSGDIFNAPFALLETFILLTSSFTCGMAMLAASALGRRRVLAWLLATFVLGATFVGLEVSEFTRLAVAGNGPSRSAFLSSYFALVGTHGLHVFIGLLWLLALIIVIARKGLARSNMRKLLLWGMFWHFLDIVWICIFTIVYLMGI